MFFFLFFIGFKVGFCLATMQEERYEKDKRFFIDEIKKLGGEVIFASADGSEEKQRKIIEDMSDKVKVIVMQPQNTDPNWLEGIIKAKGIKVIAYDRMIMNSDIDFYITHDSFLVGFLQAKEAVKWASGRKGKFFIIAGEKGHIVSEQITLGNLEVLRAYKFDVGGIFYHKNWSPEEGYKTAKSILENERNILGFLCNNSGLARGVVGALKEKGLEGKIFVAGADADKENLEYIKSGIQMVEILKDVEVLARKAAYIAYEILNKREPKYDKIINNGKKDVKTILLGVELVTKENVSKFLK